MKTKKSFLERLPLILAFALPVLIMLGIFAGKQIYPFGDNCFLRTDLYHQYVAFFEDFGDRLREGKSLLYAFDIGLGSNYPALFAYYLCGPLHLLAFLVPTEFVIEFITFLIVLKIGLCGWAMAWYLSKRFNTNSFGITICGVCYALSGYLAAYSWNVMWLDVLWLSVFVIYGLEKLIKENKPFLYCITLALSILCNYYISIMLCAFLVLYFINRLIALPSASMRHRLKNILNFVVYSLLAGAMAAVLLIPAAYALQGTASANTTFPRTISNYFSIIEMLSRHLVVVECEIGLDHWPNIYSGVLVFLLVPLYYMNKRISFREKIANTVLLGILLLSFNMNVLDYMWHGFHYPNSLPCRFSFLYTFVLTVMCFQGFRHMEYVKKETLVRIMWIAIGLILLAEVVTDSKEIPYYACYASIAFIALYTLFIYLYKSKRLEKASAIILIISLLIIEMGLNTAVTSVSFVNRSDFMMYNDSIDKLVETAEKDTPFTRIERQYLRTKNDGVYFGYNSASIFSSTTNALISDFYRKVGLEGNTNAYAVTGATPFMWSFLSIGYRITDNRLPASPIYELVETADNRKGGINYLYKNLYTLPLGYLVPADVNDLWTLSASTPIRTQNSYANLTAGSGNVFDTVPSSVNGATLTANVEKAGHYFVNITSSSVRKVTATINGQNSRVWDSIDRGYLVDFGYVEEGDELKVVASDVNSMTATLHRLNVDNFIDFYETLAAHPFTITEFTDRTFRTQIKGTADAADESLLVFSIPYDKGWSITIDGQKAPIVKLGGAFLSVKLTAGMHEIVLSYIPEGLALGVIISLIALGLFLISLAIYLILRGNKKKKDPLPPADRQDETAQPENEPESPAPSVPEPKPASSEPAPVLSPQERLLAMHQFDENEREDDAIEALEQKLDQAEHSLEQAIEIIEGDNNI